MSSAADVLTISTLAQPEYTTEVEVLYNYEEAIDAFIRDERAAVMEIGNREYIPHKSGIKDGKFKPAVIITALNQRTRVGITCYNQKLSEEYPRHLNVVYPLSHLNKMHEQLRAIANGFVISEDDPMYSSPKAKLSDIQRSTKFVIYRR